MTMRNVYENFPHCRRIPNHGTKLLSRPDTAVLVMIAENELPMRIVNPHIIKLVIPDEAVEPRS